MLKTTSGDISLKTNTNNTVIVWGCIDGSDVGIGMGLFKNSSGVSTVYHSVNKDYSFGNNLLTLYSIAYLGSARHEMKMTNIDINMDTNSTIYTNYLRNGTATGVINTYNLKMMTNLNMNNFTLTNFTFPSANLTGSDTISVNTGAYNYLRKGNITLTGVSIAGVGSNCFNIENNKSESSGIMIDGDFDGISAYCPRRFWIYTKFS